MGTNREKEDELIEDLIHLEDEEGKTADDLDLLRPVDIFVAFKFLWLDKNGNEYPTDDDIHEQVIDYGISERELTNILHRLRKHALISQHARAPGTEPMYYYALDRTAARDKLALPISWRKSLRIQ